MRKENTQIKQNERKGRSKFKHEQDKTQKYRQVKKAVRILIQKDLQTHQENLVAQTIERSKSLNYIRKGSNGQHQIIAIKNQNGVEERHQDKTKTII